MTLGSPCICTPWVAASRRLRPVGGCGQSAAFQFRTVLSHIAKRSNPSRERKPQYRKRFQETSVSRERELVSRSFGAVHAMRATGVAGLRTGSERIVDDGLDGPRTAAAFGAAAQAVIDVFGAPQYIVSRTDGVADIVVAEDVAGANNHGNAKDLRGSGFIDIEVGTRTQKKKPAFEVIPNWLSYSLRQLERLQTFSSRGKCDARKFTWLARRVDSCSSSLSQSLTGV